ncbi:hypothetical protein A3D23_04205 [candidate division WOR-1 bacterium RIFCSPHIGHO2_02_FULL_53_26]|nr:MAG: hypothetical protein A3D23_04205 [candidate division WOR-1 bacterium RIFCSPHIGHO2_02_FULL_53_26]
MGGVEGIGRPQSAGSTQKLSVYETFKQSINLLKGDGSTGDLALGNQILAQMQNAGLSVNETEKLLNLFADKLTSGIR